MGAKDIVTKDYTKECDVFADAFNQYIYKGKQVIKPENLKPLDTDITGIPYGADGAGVPVQRFRDVLKSVTAMEDATNEGIQQGRQKGIQDERIAMAKRMLEEGCFPLELIARMASLSVEEVQALLV